MDVVVTFRFRDVCNRISASTNSEFRIAIDRCWSYFGGQVGSGSRSMHWQNYVPATVRLYREIFTHVTHIHAPYDTSFCSIQTHHTLSYSIRRRISCSLFNAFGSRTTSWFLVNFHLLSHFPDLTEFLVELNNRSSAACRAGIR